jgi:hypothetical protein
LLSEVDRERLRLEEVFREEVRKTLQQPKTTGQRVFDFFNSSLGVFILSAILLGGLSAAATKWFENHQRHAQERETIRRLDIEIAYRLDQLPILASGVITYTQLHTAKGAILGKAEYHPQVGKLGEFEPIFPEFLGRTLFFLIWELQRTLPPDQRQLFDGPLSQARLLPTFVDIMVLVKPVSGEDSRWAMPEKDRARFRSAVAALQLSRWKP